MWCLLNHRYRIERVTYEDIGARLCVLIHCAPAVAVRSRRPTAGRPGRGSVRTSRGRWWGSRCRRCGGRRRRGPRSWRSSCPRSRSRWPPEGRARSGRPGNHREIADLAGERMFDVPSRRTATLEEKFELVAAGHGLVLVPLSVARAYVRPDVVYRPVADATMAETCLAVMGDAPDKLLREFIDIAVEVLRR
ncbi:hypothetical protein D7D52_26840 [Nocardia yunnanensis]|uniref:LysR substrate-binding domain-containing protein n=1 Tax=Nocardia yunnanensis TaxID=2382165 RepID=A0A386ZH48_9NOCA|nr:LysR substrate-binding domain-containing protein [Nocardia yunnanensis]AYF76831.1 hypothetical protein D7D52_26840 [Nocardia yunnanensis]